MIYPHNLARHELIGLNIEVAGGSQLSMVGISGRVVDETRNMMVIETAKGERRVPKSHARFIFILPSGNKVKVNGSILLSQPENRIHKRIHTARWKL